MESFMTEFTHLKIHLEEIISATNNFDEAKVIGYGGFGRVYGGEMTRFKGHSKVAIKRLDKKYGQGGVEFWKEITILHRHRHENLISLLGYCIDGGEMILVYEYASNGSLDRHIGSTKFTWTQRLKTCLAAARGLSFLHDARGTKERVIHRDMKCSNILLDANWNTKVSDMGLSRITPVDDEHYTGVYTLPAGTIGYCHPLYMKTNLLKKESDVYSFGVVLFEVLCGRLCFEQGTDRLLVPMWEESYEQNKLQEIIFDVLKQQMDQSSLKTYSDIAYQCLQGSRMERPTMPHVVEELETALTYQELHESVKLPVNYKKMLLTATDPQNSLSESELKLLFLKGILINNGNTWFSCNMNGDNCEMISIGACLTSTSSESQHYISSPEYTSRFAVGCYEPCGTTFETHVRTQFLSPQITYTVNLVFKRKNSDQQYIGLEYKLSGEQKRYYSFVSDVREDGWLSVELYQFTSDKRNVDLEIIFYTHWCKNLVIESIEFQPLEKVKHEVLRAENVDIQPESDTDTYWEQKLPIDYVEIIRRSINGVKWDTKKELYHILCEGFLINFGEEWFSLAKDGKKCLMLPAKAVLKKHEWKWNSEPKTRFGQVATCISKTFGIICKFSSEMLSQQTTYAAYLVYSSLPHKCNDINAPVQVVNDYLYPEQKYNIYLSTPQTPVISFNEKEEEEEEETFSPSIRPRIKGLPRLRSDGWMEVHIYEFQTRATIATISTNLRFSSYDLKSLAGITVQGVELRPI